jgi:hypothetical protein
VIHGNICNAPHVRPLRGGQVELGRLQHSRRTDFGEGGIVIEVLHQYVLRLPRERHVAGGCGLHCVREGGGGGGGSREAAEVEGAEGRGIT